jgi:hypothetical protein
LAVSYRGFKIELYEEYLSDGGFVVDQRQILLGRPSGKWGQMSEWDDRLEAYIDGLCVGGDLALDCCLRRAEEGEVGELNCALRVFCRQSRFDLIDIVLKQDVNQSPRRISAVGEAIKHEPIAHMDILVKRLVDMDSRLLEQIAKVIGYQRLPLTDFLLQHTDPPAGRATIWALGRIREDSARQALREMPNLEESSNSRALALLRAINYLDPREDWPTIAYGLMGQTAKQDQLLSSITPESTLALGLIGLSSSIPELIRRLPSPEAAVSLQLITGAGITKEERLPDETLEPGDRPTTALQISDEVASWTKWWNENEQDFSRGGRFRSGIAYSPNNLVALLRDPSQMHLERYWNAEQLATCHETALSLEIDMPVPKQLAVLSNLT